VSDTLGPIGKFMLTTVRGQDPDGNTVPARRGTAAAAEALAGAADLMRVERQNRTDATSRRLNSRST